jgi:hypothetical protein
VSNGTFGIPALAEPSISISIPAFPPTLLYSLEPVSTSKASECDHESD